MGRRKRALIEADGGSLHLISRIVGQERLLNNDQKEYFMYLMERFAAGFFVRIHAFAILDSHWHILATEMRREAKQATKEELLQRYKLIYPNIPEHPPGSYRPNGHLIPDNDNGIERLRKRLGSVSRFVQEVKQVFSRWYNTNNNRKGYLWSDRFKSIIVEKGESELVCSAYIDLNPVRAGIVDKPEDYRWCSLGMRTRNPRRAESFLTWFSVSRQDQWTDKKLVDRFRQMRTLDWYRAFVYQVGGVKQQNKASIPKELANEVTKLQGKLKLGDKLQFRMRNLSEGLAIGSHTFIKNIQQKLGRKFIRPRPFIKTNNNADGDANPQTHRLFVTRVLRL